MCAGVAQLVEQLTCNQPVGGSTPLASSILSFQLNLFLKKIVLIKKLLLIFFLNLFFSTNMFAHSGGLDSISVFIRFCNNDSKRLYTVSTSPSGIGGRPLQLRQPISSESSG